MTRREWGWLFAATGGAGALLAGGAGLVAGLRWLWHHGLSYLRDTHLETLVALSLIGIVALCVVVAILAARPREIRVERVRPGIGPQAMRRLAELQAGVRPNRLEAGGMGRCRVGLLERGR